MNDSAFEIALRGHRITGWPAGIAMMMLGVVPWFIGVCVLILTLFGQFKLVW